MSNKSFARGVKLTTQHVYTPATELATDLSNVALEAKESLANTRFQWVLPMLNSRMFETTTNKLYLPFIIPEFQENFNLTTKQVVSTQRILRSLSVSFDTRAEPYAIVDNYFPAFPTEGTISAADMTRYTIYIKLFEKVPTIIGGTTYDRTERWSATIPGVEAYASAFFRSNPLSVDSINIQIHPFRTYFFEISVPGLWAATPAGDTLAMPSFTLQAVVSSPLVTRDADDEVAIPTVQNLPLVHDGARSPDTVTVTTPAADAVIDGTTDIQATHQTLESIMRNRLRSGYGHTAGLESDVFPTEHLGNDTALSVIIIPMWQGFEDTRGSEIATKGMPYTTGPNYVNPTCDRRLLVVPDGFVLHHAFAVCSTNAPPCPLTGGNATWGTPPTEATFHNKVGIALNSGIGGDDYKYQQVAYASWYPGSTAPILVDSLLPNINSTIPVAWQLFELPLVSDGAGVATSFITTGPPFFMGQSNTTTKGRTDTGNAPTLFGGAAYNTPGTAGGETTLEVRWLMENTLAGLNAVADDALIGTGGHWIILVGKATVAD